MKDQIVMAPNGNCAVAVPLYRREHEDSLVKLKGYSIVLAKDKPIAYAIDCGPEYGNAKLMDAEFVEKHLEFLGEL